MSKRGRPYRFAPLAELQVGESVTVIASNLDAAQATAKTLRKKKQFAFEVTDQNADGWKNYRRVA